MKKRAFGSIFRCKRPDGSRLPNLYVSWTDAQGRRHQRVAGPTRKEAEDLLSRLQGEKLMARGARAQARGPRRTPDLTSALRSPHLPLMTHCVQVLSAWRSSLAPGTLRGRRSALERWFVRLDNEHVDAITKQRVQECVRQMGREKLKPSTIKTEVQVLSAVFETLAREFSISLPHGNPCHGLRLPRLHQNPRRYLSPEDVRRFLDSCPDRFRGAMTLLADCGLRPAELLRLDWSQVALDPGPTGSVRLANTKTHQTRTIPLTPRAREILLQARASVPGAAPKERVFVLPEKALRAAFHEARATAGLPDLEPYDLRHAYACNLLQEGVAIAVVRDLLGHRNLATTDIYLRSLPGGAAEDAVAALARAYGATEAPPGPTGPPAPSGPP